MEENYKFEWQRKRLHVTNIALTEENSQLVKTSGKFTFNVVLMLFYSFGFRGRFNAEIK